MADGEQVTTGEAHSEGVVIPGEDRPALTEVEQIASEAGWRPRDQYQGEGWRSAADFLRQVPGGRQMKRELRSLRDQVERMASTGAAATRRALDEEAGRIEARFNEAVENKDTAGAAKAARDMEKLRSDAAGAEPVRRDYEAEFAERNPWFGSNRPARALAIMVSQEMAGQGKSVEDQLEGAEKAVREAYPDLFNAPRRDEPARVAAPSRSTGAKREKGYADLPPEAKRAADSYADLFKSRHGKDVEQSRKQYAADYWNEVGTA